MQLLPMALLVGCERIDEVPVNPLDGIRAGVQPCGDGADFADDLLNPRRHHNTGHGRLEVGGLGDKVQALAQKRHDHGVEAVDVGADLGQASTGAPSSFLGRFLFCGFFGRKKNKKVVSR